MADGSTAAKTLSNPGQGSHLYPLAISLRLNGTIISYLTRFETVWDKCHPAFGRIIKASKHDVQTNRLLG